MDQIFAWSDQAVYFVSLLLGFLICFAGYRLFRFWLVLAGLQTGFFFGLLLGGRLLDNTVLVLVVAGLCALVAAALSYALIKFGAFFCGAAVAALAAVLVMRLFLAEPYWPVLMAAAFLGGLLGVLSVRPYLILATALNGAFLAVDAIYNLCVGSPLGRYLEQHQQMRVTHLILLLVAMLALTLTGTMVQLRADRIKRARILAEQANQAGKSDSDQTSGGAAREDAAGTPDAAAREDAAGTSDAAAREDAAGTPDDVAREDAMSHDPKHSPKDPGTGGNPDILPL